MDAEFFDLDAAAQQISSVCTAQVLAAVWNTPIAKLPLNFPNDATEWLERVQSQIPLPQTVGWLCVARNIALHKTWWVRSAEMGAIGPPPPSGARDP